jgi:hypothetical protein
LLWKNLRQHIARCLATKTMMCMNRWNNQYSCMSIFGRLVFVLHFFVSYCMLLFSLLYLEFTHSVCIVNCLQ